jgi:signal transduction histidine kinase
MQTGMLMLDKSELRLQGVLQESIEAAATLCSEKKVTIEAASTPLTVYADRHRLLQILSNLLANAIASSRTEGKISVWASEDDGHVRIFVKDAGLGMSPELQASVFERYGRMPGAGEATAHEGSGLGLFICRSLVEAHGGTIKVESEINRGSIFSFSIPKAEPTRALSSRSEVGS